MKIINKIKTMLPWKHIKLPALAAVLSTVFLTIPNSGEAGVITMTFSYDAATDQTLLAWSGDGSGTFTSRTTRNLTARGVLNADTPGELELISRGDITGEPPFRQWYATASQVAHNLREMERFYTIVHDNNVTGNAAGDYIFLQHDWLLIANLDASGSTTASGTATFAGDFDDLGLDFSGGDATLSFGVNTVVIRGRTTNAPVPEPTTFAMFGAAFALLGFISYRTRYNDR